MNRDDLTRDRGTKSGQRAHKREKAELNKARQKKATPPKTPEQVEEAETEFVLRKRQQIAKLAWEMDEVDGKILELKMQFPTMSQTDIADILGMSRQGVATRLSADKFKRAIALANETALSVFQSNQARAARTLGRLLKSKDERVALRAAVTHLWSLIHKSGGGDSEQDFAKFVVEAYEMGEAEKAGGTSAGAARSDVDSPSRRNA